MDLGSAQKLVNKHNPLSQAELQSYRCKIQATCVVLVSHNVRLMFYIAMLTYLSIRFLWHLSRHFLLTLVFYHNFT